MNYSMIGGAGGRLGRAARAAAALGLGIGLGLMPGAVDAAAPAPGSGPAPVLGAVHPRTHTLAVPTARPAFTSGVRTYQVTAGSAMTYHSGTVLTVPHIKLVFWGPNWTSSQPVVNNLPPPAPTAGLSLSPSHQDIAAYVRAFAASLGGSPWMQTLTQYCQGSPGAGATSCADAAPATWIQNPPVQYDDSVDYWLDLSTPPTTPSDADIDAEAVRAAAHWYPNGAGRDPNTVYMVYTQNGSAQSAYSQTTGGGFCAWHTATSSPAPGVSPWIAYAYLPSVAGSLCAPISSASAFYYGFTVYMAHEYAEAVTDPLPDTGWEILPAAMEIGDICVNAPITYTHRGTQSFPVPSLQSNGDGGCVTQTNLPGPPQSLSVKAVGQSMALAWTPPAYSGGGSVSGYRVYCSPGCGGPFAVSASTTSLTVTPTGAASGTQAYVAAVNGYGTGGAIMVPAGSSFAGQQSPPGPPLSAAGLGSAGGGSVTFAAPTSDGGTPVIRFDCLAQADGLGPPIRVSAAPPATTCQFSGLTTGTYYTVAVTAINALGSSQPVYTGFFTTPAAGSYSSSGDYFPLSPARILDTRAGLGAAAQPVGPGGQVDLQVAGAGGVPAYGAAAVVLNLTVDGPTAPSYLTAWPTGAARPVASNLNYRAGDTIPNLVTVKLGDGGRVSLFNYSGQVNVIADVVGWYSGGSTVGGDRLEATPPLRLLDTRIGIQGLAGPVGPGSAIDVQVTGPMPGLGGAAPPAGADAVVLNVTATAATAPSYLTVYPTGDPLPVASSLNFKAGQTIANLVIARIGSGGRVTIFNYAGTTQVVADVMGFYVRGSVGGRQFVPLPPARVLDTRDGTGGYAGRVGPGQSLNLGLLGAGGVPASGVSAVAINVTVDGSTASGYLTVWPAGAPMPVASNLNWAPGQTIPNGAIARLGGSGQLSIFNYTGSASVVVDVLGYYLA